MTGSARGGVNEHVVKPLFTRGIDDRRDLVAADLDEMGSFSFAAFPPGASSTLQVGIDNQDFVVAFERGNGLERGQERSADRPPGAGGSGGKNPIEPLLPTLMGLIVVKGLLFPTGSVVVYIPVRNATQRIPNVSDLIVLLARTMNSLERGLVGIWEFGRRDQLCVDPRGQPW